MKKKIKVSGMSCNHCKDNVKKTLETLDGLSYVDVNLENGEVSFDCDIFDEVLISSKIEEIGFDYEGEV
ncbi:MAG: heavy-metal-associated domain-containing protein [Candidatus Delongbacteria bacterium]|nr:heavy-metal-associated domain-containing protein [Candidatus Delongbacteria bacterium]MBN2835336.1 heavy-metal-associated domain-containing protein [Candidatus Delongbacteria bacterium]